MTEKKIKNNMSSSGLTRRSRNGVESGRSMVEMLGVLAVVGVLSVGSIAGYRYAMDNYYTNEILAGASQRAVLVAAQIAAGQKISLAEFDKIETAGGEFDGTIKEWDGEFGIQVSGVKESVCKNLIKATLDTDIIITDTDGVDLAESDCSGDNNTFLFVYSSDMGGTPDTACLDVECPDGSTCSRGQCQCSNGLFVCGTQCCAEGTYCTQGADTSTYACTEPSGECSSNSDCGENEYCKFTSGSCTNPGTGTCTDKGTLTPYTLNLPGGALTVYKGSDGMYWWNASNLCQAHGKQMVTMADLGLADSGTNTTCYFNSSDSAYATAPCICNGGLDNDCSATNAAIRAHGNFQFWLADNSKESSCFARHVLIESGRVINSTRIRVLKPRALCR